MIVSPNIFLSLPCIFILMFLKQDKSDTYSLFLLLCRPLTVAMLRKMFTRSLERVVPKSWEIFKAECGETALRLVESKHYDIIFMDQYFASIEKQMLGTETVRALRSRGVTSIICGLSANDMKEQFIEAGANTFMSKPFPCDQVALRTEMYRVLDSRETRKTV
jgi:CheY-like chemotaxis protein